MADIEYADGELSEEATHKKFLLVRQEGNRKHNRKVVLFFVCPKEPKMSPKSFYACVYQKFVIPLQSIMRTIQNNKNASSCAFFYIYVEKLTPFILLCVKNDIKKIF